MLPPQALGLVKLPRFRGTYYLTRVGADSTIVGVMSRTLKGLEHTVLRMVEDAVLDEYGFDHEDGPTREIRVVSLCPTHLKLLWANHTHAIERWIHQEVASRLNEYQNQFGALPEGWKEHKVRTKDEGNDHVIHLWGNRAFQWAGPHSVAATYRSKVEISFDSYLPAYTSRAEPSDASTDVIAYYGGHRNPRGDSFKDTSPWEMVVGDCSDVGPIDYVPTFFFQVVRELPDTLSEMIQSIRGTEEERARMAAEEDSQIDAIRETETAKRAQELKNFFVL